MHLSRRTVAKGISSIAGLSVIAGFPVVFSPALAAANPVNRPPTRKPSGVRTQKPSKRPPTRKPSSSGRN
jgi:hypothetical protein